MDKAGVAFLVLICILVALVLSILMFEPGGRDGTTGAAGDGPHQLGTPPIALRRNNGASGVLL